MLKATKRREVYLCSVCGNIVEVLHPGRGQLECCNKPMFLLEEKTSGTGSEKHIPIIKTSEEEVIIEVGSIPHPMEDGHYIEWIEISVDDFTHRKFLKPRDEPKAVFRIKAKRITARAYCNLHGLWRTP